MGTATAGGGRRAVLQRCCFTLEPITPNPCRCAHPQPSPSTNPPPSPTSPPPRGSRFAHSPAAAGSFGEGNERSSAAMGARGWGGGLQAWVRVHERACMHACVCAQPYACVRAHRCGHTCVCVCVRASTCTRAPPPPPGARTAAWRPRDRWSRGCHGNRTPREGRAAGPEWRPQQRRRRRRWRRSLLRAALRSRAPPAPGPRCDAERNGGGRG